MSRITDKIREPIITNRTLDLMVIALWSIYGAWGITATAAAIPTLEDAATPLYGLVWGGLIGVGGLVASSSATANMFSTTIKMRRRTKQVELWAVCILAGLISVYPTLLLVAAISGDDTRSATAIVSLSYLVVPTWRVLHLVARIRALRTLAQ